MRRSKNDPSRGQLPNVFVRGLGALVLTMTGAACASSSASSTGTQSPDTRAAQVLAEVLETAQSECTIRTPTDPTAATDTPPSAFVEMSLIEVPAAAHWQLTSVALADVPRLPGAKLVASPHVIARLDTPTTMDLGTRILPLGATLEAGMFFKRMTVLPRFDSSGEGVLDLQLVLDTSEPELTAGQEGPVERHVRNTFVVHDRKTAMLHAVVAGYSRGSLLILVKPYLVRSQYDLRDIFACKMQLRQRTMARQAAVGD